MEQDERDRLAAGALQLGIPLTPHQLDQFARYAELLDEWNARMNLTRVPREEYVPLHFLDSLAAWTVRPVRAGDRCLDVGTGAGLPGIPIKIAAPEAPMTLLDSTRKRLTFLEAVIAELQLADVRTVHGRAEDAARLPEHRERYDLVYARAVARLDTLASWLLPFVRVGGTAIALKSRDVDQEVRESRGAIRGLGGGDAVIHTLRIPGTDILRAIVVIPKLRSSPRSRRPGQGFAAPSAAPNT